MIISLKADRLPQAILRKRVIAKIWDILPIMKTWDEVFDEGFTKCQSSRQLDGSREPNNQSYRFTYVNDVCKDPGDGELIFNPVEPETMETEEYTEKMWAKHRDHTFLFKDNIFFLINLNYQNGQTTSATTAASTTN